MTSGKCSRAVDLIDRAMAQHIAGEIQDQTIIFAIALARTATDHLHIETGRQRWPQHRNQIHGRQIKAGSQDVDIGQSTDLALIKGGDNGVALIIRCLSCYRRRDNAALTQAARTCWA